MNHAQIPAGPFDVAVIGGGLAGLTAAATAAGRGARTLLIDARRVGGRARSTEREGFTLNEGGHALYRSAGGWDVLASLGVTPIGGPPPLDEASTVWNGDVVDLPFATKDVLTSRLLSTRSKLKLGGWLRDPGALAAEVGDVTFGDWLDTERAKDDLRRYILTIARLTTYAARPEHLPARSVLAQLAAGSDGVVYLDGGWQSLVDGLRRAAAAAGVSVVEGAPAIALEPGGARGGDRWTIGTRDAAFGASSVVLAAGGAKLATDLLGSDDAGWVERSGPVLRAACLDVGATTSARGLLLSSDEPLYCTRHAPAARLAPEGHTLHTAMRYLAADDPSTAEQNRAALDEHADLAGLPARGERVLERFLAAPVVAWGSPQVGVERPSGLELADRGVFAAGDWIGDRMLADASLVTGAAAGVGAVRHAMVSV